MKTIMLKGEMYFITFIDNSGRMVTVNLMKNRNEISRKFKEYIEWFECQIKKKIQVLRADNTKEYQEGMLKEICLSKGIEQEFIVPYSPQQNGVAERFNRTLVEMGTCLLKQANMSPT